MNHGVVALTGNVNSQSKRPQTEKIASAVPNVKQIVNELQVRDQNGEFDALEWRTRSTEGRGSSRHSYRTGCGASFLFRQESLPRQSPTVLR